VVGCCQRKTIVRSLDIGTIAVRCFTGTTPMREDGGNANRFKIDQMSAAVLASTSETETGPADEIASTTAAAS